MHPRTAQALSEAQGLNAGDLKGLGCGCLVYTSAAADDHTRVRPRGARCPNYKPKETHERHSYPASQHSPKTHSPAISLLNYPPAVSATHMTYAPGSPECRVLNDCKAQIETMLLALSRTDNSRHIPDQLVAVHNQLEGLHELHRRQPLAALAGE